MIWMAGLPCFMARPSPCSYQTRGLEPSSAVTSVSRMPALDRFRASPASHLHRTFSTASMAIHALTAITATPPLPPWNGGSSTRSSTPGSFFTSSDGDSCSLPPSVGHICTLA
ncbi:hypothetical protein D9M69_451250 [compost metagenome]